MSPLVIFRENFINALRASAPQNIDKYLQDEIWAGISYPRGSRDLDTSVELGDHLVLESPDNGNLRDFENAVRLHKILRNLTPLQARDPRLWTRMTHIVFWNYMRARWPVEKHIGSREKALRFVESRYFVPQSQSRALLRNGIARLWWTAHMSYEPERDNPYELTSVLLSTLDITQQILERSMGRADNVIKGFLEFLLRNSALLAGGNINRSRIRNLAKYLNLYGGVCLLDCLSRGEIMEVLESELVRSRV